MWAGMPLVPSDKTQAPRPPANWCALPPWGYPAKRLSQRCYCTNHTSAKVSRVDELLLAIIAPLRIQTIESISSAVLMKTCLGPVAEVVFTLSVAEAVTSKVKDLYASQQFAE